MKGIEWKVILSILLLVVFLLLMAYFLSPMWASGKEFFNQAEFRRYCAWWATDDYKDAYAKGDPGGEKDMSDFCNQALGLKCPPDTCLSASDSTNPNWEKCKSLCKLQYPKV